MTSLVEQFAAQIGWQIATNNVVVEGTSDVALLRRAAELHSGQHGRSILDSQFGIQAAGQGDDGGVDGVNRGLIAMRQIADADRDANGALRYRFVGLFDNDYAGRAAFNLASRFDPRIERYKDIFLLVPVMPAIGDGISDRLIEATQANLPFAGLDWEIEDLCSERLLNLFEQQNPEAVVSRMTVNGKTHREFDRSAKSELVRLFGEDATLDDAQELVKLLKLMRGYFGLDHSFIQA